MAPEMRSVFSSVVDTIGYDEESQQLIVVWARSGKTSIYSGVSADVANGVINAPSVGQALHERIKPNYDHRYV